MLIRTRRLLPGLFALVLMTALTGSSAPGSSTAHWAWVHGHRIYYESIRVQSRAVDGRARPLLLLHGGGASIAQSFYQQLGAFAAGHRIIAPEQVGQGHSPDVDGPLSYAAMMEDTAELLRQLHVSDVDVIGWSDGGILALMLAIQYPQLVHSLVISGANVSPDGLLDDEIASLQADSAGADANNKLTKLWLSSPTRDELNWESLRRLEKPVLLLAGDHDVIKPVHTRDIYHALPQARLIVLPDTGHATFAQRPEIVNPLVLDFFAQNRTLATN